MTYTIEILLLVSLHQEKKTNAIQDSNTVYLTVCTEHSW